MILNFVVPRLALTAQRACINVLSLRDLDAVYPKAEAIASALGVKTIDIYRKNEFITSIDVEAYAQASRQYDRVRLPD